MRYTVIWKPLARGQLADLWVNAPDRQAVADASNRIEPTLRDNPEAKGMPWGRFYTWIDEPLTVLFEVDPGDCMVRILLVRRTTP